MGIKSLCAAIAVMIGIGQAADAATVVYDVNITLRLAEETVWPEGNYTGNPISTRYEEYWTVPNGKTRQGQFIIEEISSALGRAIIKVGGTVIYDETGDASVRGVSIWKDKGVSWRYTSFEWINGMGKLVDSYDGDYSFQVEADIMMSPSPVPLPATAVLLPVGIGTLGIMRKRRRSLE